MTAGLFDEAFGLAMGKAAKFSHEPLRLSLLADVFCWRRRCDFTAGVPQHQNEPLPGKGNAEVKAN